VPFENPRRASAPVRVEVFKVKERVPGQTPPILQRVQNLGGLIGQEGIGRPESIPQLDHPFPLARGARRHGGMVELADFQCTQRVRRRRLKSTMGIVQRIVLAVLCMQAAVSANQTQIHLLLLVCTPVPVCASLAMVELRACSAQLDGTRQLQAQKSVNLAQRVRQLSSSDHHPQKTVYQREGTTGARWLASVSAQAAPTLRL
jgi:hypothetical protein